MNSLSWLALAWLAYALLHSTLAALAVKAWVARHWPAVMPAYRLAFNLVAIASAVPLVWLTYATPGDWLWRWTGPWAWLANGLALAAIGGVLATASAYDMDEFVGLRQWRQHDRDASERQEFRISTVHRYVRHPWYSLALVVVWTRDMNAPLLLSALAITIYFVIGSRLEEGKLIAAHGECYRRYRARVPGLLPLPWKRLTAAEAIALTRNRDP